MAKTIVPGDFVRISKLIYVSGRIAFTAPYAGQKFRVVLEKTTVGVLSVDNETGTVLVRSEDSTEPFWISMSSVEVC